MIAHEAIARANLKAKIKAGEILFGGHKKLKIYGKLGCSSGKRMKRSNRLFFSSEREAMNNNYRPCGHCMRAEYKKWKNETVRPGD